MLAEISAVVGVLKALNSGIKTVKESGSHLSDLSSLFTALTESKAVIKTIEETTTSGNHVLTQEEALELAWAKNEIREQEKALKKITPREVWRDMLSIQHKSLMEHKDKVAKQNKAIAKKKQAVNSIISGVLFWIMLAAIAYGTVTYLDLL